MKKHFFSFLSPSSFLIYSSKRVVRRVRVSRKKINPDYIKNKEKTRSLVLERLEFFNRSYSFYYNRVSIRDQHTRWGSCSKKANLNFNYRLIHLPAHLSDYVIVHELCHLEEMNHAKSFWDLVAKTFPNHRELRRELKSFKF